ncbi:helix-turn-helix domain-containing protein [Phaeobacter sp. QD34_3]|uniref:winged helix-turn-helix transcriptional regulator n=1 Tax=unclassified Phaeobacter TaxID=2621772 RepID=UPI00237F81B9|nr:MULTISPECIES: helix-turn-helix domain-containing protein [unclassified Phaeobacter]MDE4132534.1 helix-turn-helix domain-containing protein [Phaeobacter sp. QD34_3]MDE4136171.1 helix-turn-helix domain-containing protein [Phaeobacter sp. QD34_24]MDE4174467.1 helix-turn-helix domain-containing protein [Phaeobacter sp. PT47_59]
MKWHDMKDAACPVARAMAVIGDRWTLLILRECFLGTRRFDGFQQRLGITRHLLAERLKRLESAGLLKRHPYQERPLRHEYRLTDSGKAFAPVMLALQDWSRNNLPCDDSAPISFVLRENGAEIDPVLTDRRSGQELNHRTVLMRPNTETRAKG